MSPINHKHILSKIFPLIYPQLILLGVLIILEFLRWIGFIPPPSELLKFFNQLIASGGWWLLLLISFLEHLVGVNVYFPGSIVIFVAVSSFIGQPWSTVLAVLATMTGAILAHQINFFIGRRFRSKNIATQNIPTQSVRWKYLGMASMFWHPHFGALSAIVAGREGVRYWTATTIIIVATIFWQTLWGLFAYNTTKALGQNNFGFWPMLGCVLIWIIVDLYRAKDKIKF